MVLEDFLNNEPPLTFLRLRLPKNFVENDGLAGRPGAGEQLTEAAVSAMRALAFFQRIPLL